MLDRPTNPYTVSMFPNLTEHGTVKCELYVTVPSSTTLTDTERWSLAALFKPYLNQTSRWIQQMSLQGEKEAAQKMLTESFRPSYELTEPGQKLTGYDYNICESEEEFEAACRPKIASGISFERHDVLVVAPVVTVNSWENGNFGVRFRRGVSLSSEHRLNAEKAQAKEKALATMSNLTFQSSMQAYWSKDYDRLKQTVMVHAEGVLEQLKMDGTLPQVKTLVLDDEKNVDDLMSFLSVLGYEMENV